MNGGSTSNLTPPHKQLPRMILLIHESTLNARLLNNSALSLKCGNAINVLRIRRGIRRRRAPIEESQDRENCVRRPMFYRPADKFSTDAACADAPAHRPMRNLAQCCNRLRLESA